MFCFLFFLRSSAIFSQSDTLSQLNFSQGEMIELAKKRTLILKKVKGIKKRKFAEQIHASIILKSDSIEKAILIQNYLSDQMIVTVLEPIIMDGMVVLKVKEQRRIFYNEISKLTATSKGGLWNLSFGAGLLAAGLYSIAYPLLETPSTGGYGNAENLGFIIIGPVMTYFGYKLLQRALPKTYDLQKESIWEIRIK